MPGGTAVAALGLAKALGEVDDITSIGVTARHRRSPSPPWEPTIATLSLPLARVALYEAWHALRRPYVEQATGPVDVVHATSLIVPASARASRRHGPRPRVPRRSVPPHRARQPVHASRPRARPAQAAVVVCSSEDTRRACLEAGIDDDRLRVVLLGTDIEPASLDAIADAKPRFDLRRPYVAWVGTVEPRKNVSGLLAAFAIVARRIPDHELVLIGPSGWGPSCTRARREHRRRCAGARAGTRLPLRRTAQRGRRRRVGLLLPEHTRGLRPARARSDGAGHAGRHLAGHRDRGGRGRARVSSWIPVPEHDRECAVDT